MEHPLLKSWPPLTDSADVTQNLGRAKQFASSDLQPAMAAAGVIDQPEFYFLTAAD